MSSWVLWLFLAVCLVVIPVVVVILRSTTAMFRVSQRLRDAEMFEWEHGLGDDYYFLDGHLDGPDAREMHLRWHKKRNGVVYATRVVRVHRYRNGNTEAAARALKAGFLSYGRQTVAEMNAYRSDF